MQTLPDYHLDALFRAALEEESEEFASTAANELQMLERVGRVLARRRTRRQVVTLLLAAAITTLTAAAIALGGNRPTPPVTPERSPEPTATSVALPAGSYVLANPYQDDDPVRGCFNGCADYKRVTFTLPAGWSSSGALISKHLGEPGEVAVSIWTPGEIYADPCHWETSAREELEIHTASGEPHLGMDDDAALLNQVGRTASVPATVTLAQGTEGWGDDVGALMIELTVDPDLNLAACDGGEFRSWTEWDVPDGGNSHHVPGQIDVMYLVDVDRRTFVIDASHMPAASDADLAELEAIVASMIIDR